MRKTQRQPYSKMTQAKLREATKEFDQEFVADQFGPMPPAAKAAWRRAKKKLGRPKTGRGVKVISLSVEKDLLKQADTQAKAEGISRAAIFARGLRAVLKAG